MEKIAVEIKSFRSDSFIYDLHEALGQYLIYQPFLERKEPTRLLFLAVPGKIWLMVDNTDVRIAEELVDRGVPRTDIVLGFQPEEVRKFTDYASA